MRECLSGFPHGLESPDFVEQVRPSSLLRESGAPKTVIEEVRPQTGVFDRQLEEVIGKGVQEMMEDFITKVLPQMTQNILQPDRRTDRDDGEGDRS